MKTGNVYALLWILWILSFLVIELTALGTGKSQFTLSWYVWRLEQLGSAWTFLRYFICVFCFWLFCHMAFGWFR